MHAHFEQFALHQPFSPHVPHINPADNSLSFLDDKDTVVDPENISDDVISDTPPECVQTQPLPMLARTILVILQN